MILWDDQRALGTSLSGNNYARLSQLNYAGLS